MPLRLGLRPIAARCLRVASFLAALASAGAAVAVEFVFAVVPQFDARVIQKEWAPVLEELSRRTGHSFQLRIEQSIPDFEKGFGRGDYDFAFANPYHYLVANRQQGYVPLLRDESMSHGIVVVRKDSPIARVEELNGKVVAFPAPNALGAALIPRAEFARKFHISVTARYVKSHTSAYLNAATGQMDAAGGIQKTFDDQPPEIRDALRVLYRTPDFAPHPIMAHPRVPARIREQVRTALIELAATEPGKALMAKINMPRVVVASHADYEPLRQLGLEAFYVDDRAQN